MSPDSSIALTPTAAFVRDLAGVVADQSTYTIGRATIILGRYVDWATRVRALPLNDKLLADPQAIDLFIRDALASKQLSKSSVAAYRSVLRRTREILLPRYAPTTVTGIEQRPQLLPYSDFELDLFQPWAHGQRNDSLRRKAIALTCTGLGCGLRAGEILRLHRRDVHSDDTRITLSVVNEKTGERREVPMLARWVGDFTALIADMDGDDWVFARVSRSLSPNPNLISEFVQASNGRLHPNTYKMRSTWIVGHLAAGAHLPTLLKASGLARLEKLNEYLPYLSTPTEETFASLRMEVTR